MALIFGHRLVNNIKCYIHEDIKTVSLQDSKIADFININAIFEAVKAVPVVAVMAAENDITWSCSVEKIISDVQILCEKIHSANPSAKVIVCGVLPRCTNLYRRDLVASGFVQHFNTIASAVNSSLRRIASVVTWLHYLQFPAFTSLAGVNRELLTLDGRHVSYEGAELVSKCIQEAIWKFQHVKSEVVTQTVFIPTHKSNTEVVSVPQNISVQSVPCVIDNDAMSSNESIVCPVQLRPRAKSDVWVIELPDRFILSDDEEVTLSTSSNLVGGGYENKVYMCEKNILDWKTAKEILDDPDIEKVTPIPPYKPKAGEVYVYTTNGDPNKKDDWKADQYIWVNRQGKGCPRNQKSFWTMQYTISKDISDSEGDKAFQRRAFFYKDKPEYPYVVVQYYGDEKVFKERPHGNAINTNRKFKPTAKSVINNMKEIGNDMVGSHVEKPTNKLFAKLQTDTSVHAVHQGVLNPRNPKQVSNLLERERRTRRLTQDEIYSTLQIGYDLDGFIHELSVFPDLKCVLAAPEIIKEVDNLLKCETDFSLLFSYDTTFSIGKNFLSVLNVRHPMFENNKAIPVAFLIHDRKNQKSHELFFTRITELLPNLKSSGSCLVTDRELAITNAVKKIVPKMKLLYCWNHLKNDFKRWLEKNKLSSDEKLVYLTDLHSLLTSDSLEQYSNRELSLTSKWSEAAKAYYLTTMKSDVIKSALQCVIDACDINNTGLGITNNMSEGVNTLIKDMASWQGIPMDSIVLSLHFLQRFKVNEIIRGKMNVGTFKLKDKYLDHMLDPAEVEMPKTTVSPKEIVDLIKSGKLEQEHSDQSLPIDATKIDDVDIEKNGGVQTNVSQRALALCVIKEKRLTHVPEVGAWIVEGSAGDKYTVTLFPKPSCKCPSVNSCYHIMAVKMSVGLEERKEKRIINLTQIRVNSKKRQNKVAGKKKPRPIDRYDEMDCIVNAAPDSDANKENVGMKTEPIDNFAPDISGIRSSRHFTSTPGNIKNPKFILKELCKNMSPPSCKKMKVSADEMRNGICDNSVNVHLPMQDEICGFENNESMAGRDESTIQYGLNDSIFETSVGNNATKVIVIDDLTFKEDIQKESRTWLSFETFQLKISDKFDLNYDKKLNDRVINFGLQLLKDRFNDINGFQDCGYVPTLQTGEWKYSLRMKSKTSPVCQIHHTGNNHWVATVQAKDSSHVILFDSLKSKPYSFTRSLELQLITIYGEGKKELEVHVPDIQQQQNGVDCGVYALAFATEFCESDFDGTDHLEFNRNLMRQHLIDCFVRKHMSKFPKNVNKLRKYKRPCESEILFIAN